MSRLDDIKARLNQYIAAQGYANQRTPMLVQLRREYLHNFEQNVSTDMEYLINEVERLSKPEINIQWEYKGATDSYHIFMDDEQIHVTKDATKRDMFIAELKAKIKLMGK